jgi:hypothetical protein
VRVLTTTGGKESKEELQYPMKSFA